MSLLFFLLLISAGGLALSMVSAHAASTSKRRLPQMTEEQLFQQQMLQVQREYLQAMQQLEHEARMTQAERSEVLHRMRDYHNHP